MEATKKKISLDYTRVQPDELEALARMLLEIATDLSDRKLTLTIRSTSRPPETSHSA